MTRSPFGPFIFNLTIAPDGRRMEAAESPMANTILAACFFPTAGTGVPHAVNGMVDVVNVTG